MDTVKIRLASLNDSPEIVSLVNTAYRSKEVKGWTSESGMIGGDRINSKQVKVLLETKKSFLFLAFDQEKLIGCVHIQIEKNLGHIGLLTTHPKIQNLGLGKKLLQFAENYCVEHYHINTFEISVLSTRKELIEFYERRGYVFTGKVDSYPIDAQVGRPLLSDIQVLYFKK